MPDNHNCLTCRWASFRTACVVFGEKNVECRALEGINVPSIYSLNEAVFYPQNYWEDGTPEADTIEVQDGDYPYNITDCPAWRAKEVQEGAGE